MQGRGKQGKECGITYGCVIPLHQQFLDLPLCTSVHVIRQFAADAMCPVSDT